MKITVSRESILKPLQAIHNIVEKKQTMPILSNVLIRATENQLVLMGTDTEMELCASIPATVMELGETTTAARKLFDICRSLPEKSELHLQMDGKTLHITSGKSDFSLNTLPTENFPKSEKSVLTQSFSISEKNLKYLFSSVYFAMAQQDIRHYLNGVLLDISDHQMVSVATDGHRLALAKIEDNQINHISEKLVLPRKSVLEIMRLLNDSDQMIQIQFDDNKLQCVFDQFHLTTKLIQANYPDYQRLIPQGQWIAEIDRETLKQALHRVSILSSEKMRGVRLSLSDHSVTVSANNLDYETANESIGANYQGVAMEIAFNVTYLLDAISALTQQTVKCIFAGLEQGLLIQGLDNSDNQYVVMPMQL